MPTISIILPIYNEAPFIEEALRSLQNQSFTDFECLIGDDGSDDDSADLIRPFTEDPRFQLFQFGRLGKNGTINRLYEQSSAPWLNFFCGDDRFPEHALQNKWTCVQNHDALEQNLILYSRCRMFSTEPRFNGLELPKNPKRGSDSAPAMLFSRKLAQKVFPIPTDLPNEDQWTALVGRYFAAEHIHLPKVCWEYRIHDGNSHRRDVDFGVYSNQYHQRFRVYELFLKQFEPELELEQKTELNIFQELEELRYSGKWVRILGLNAVGIKDKIRALIYAHPVLYAIRKRFYGFFSGW